MMQCVIKKGNKLTAAELKAINDWRFTEFSLVTAWDKDHLELFGESEIFMLKDTHTKEIQAFCRLQPLKARILDKDYELWGLGAVIATRKQAGNGKLLMKNVGEFIDNPETNPGYLPALGFCSEQVTGFYRKCGFKILEKGTDRFIYIDAKGRKHKNQNPGNAVFYPGNNVVLELLDKNPDLIVKHYLASW